MMMIRPSGILESRHKKSTVCAIICLSIFGARGQNTLHENAALFVKTIKHYIFQSIQRQTDSRHISVQKAHTSLLQEVPMGPTRALARMAPFCPPALVPSPYDSSLSLAKRWAHALRSK